MTGFIVTAIVMLIAVIPCGIVMVRGKVMEAVVAYEVVSSIAVMVLILLAQGFRRPVMRDVYRKVHFVTPAALVAPVLVVLAVFVQEGLDENTGESLLALLFVLIAGPYLTHATIRAARIRDQGDWRGRKAGPGPSGEPAASGEPAPSGEGS